MLEGVKIALGYKIRNGPWGGGNQFLISFKDYFESGGARVTDHLEEALDMVVMVNPRKGSGTFDYNDVLKYKRRNPKTKIIFRVNDTDKSGKIYKADKLRLKSCRLADAVVFISDWIRDYYIERGFDCRIPHIVIRNGADENIFNPQGYSVWDSSRPLKIVTHHWSDNCMKGADIYQYFDQLLDDPWMKQRFEFTYIGQLPSYPTKVQFRNTRYIPPLSGMALAGELKKHHVYLTAARWEGCGMHQLEGACCGLPVLFIDEGGGAVECCEGFGIQFTKDTFAISLFKMLKQYIGFQPKMRTFPLNATLMVRKYADFILSVLKK
ncbi:MAG: hypothetical protein M0R66_00180 [Candidatus Omnitrophica bacterium]|nr:hypothetical protein [Candidatus Omnitrophota bacterium]